MANCILKLDELTANKIAAGEVVDKPASVVKELVENSIDAQAKNIIIEIKDGGKSYIRITDDGSGIYPDDVEIAFERHATSKIKEINDLDTILSLGFRGEALASIASVSKIELITKHNTSATGTHIKVHGGKFIYKKEVGSSTGTTMIVEDLFYNTPARLEFMKSNQSESAAISDIVGKLALSHPAISFQFINNGTIIFTSSGGKKLNNIVNIYGKELAKSLIEVNHVNDYFSIEGYISKPSYTRGNRQLQIFYVNGRYVKSKVFNDALAEAYNTLIPSNKFPVAFLYIDINPNFLDINIHPTKMEIRMREEELVKNKIIHIIKSQLFQNNLVPDFYKPNRESNFFVQDKTPPYNSTINTKDKLMKEIKEPEIKKPIVEEKFVQDPVIEEQVRIEDSKIQSIDSSPNMKSNIREDLDPKDSKNSEVIYNRQDPVVDFQNINLIGQAFQTYILGAFQDSLYIIDQHAAHERVIFEELLNNYKKSSVISQKLISPIVVEVSHTQFENTKIYLYELNKLGFEVEEFGTNSYLLRSVPVIWGKPRNKDFFMDVLDNLNIDMTKNDSIIERIITQSCKSAIKAMDTLDMIEMKELLRKLSTLDNPYTCPHGRPTIIKLTKKEIERKFMRT